MTAVFEDYPVMQAVVFVAKKNGVDLVSLADGPGPGVLTIRIHPVDKIEVMRKILGGRIAGYTIRVVEFTDDPYSGLLT